MLSSPTLGNSSTSPIFYVDDHSSYLIDDATNYSPYSLIYNEIDNFGGFFTKDELSIIQQSVLDDDDNIENNNIYSSIDIIDNCSKMDSKKSGDHESDQSINGIVEDNGEANQLISSSTTTTTTTTSHRHELMKKRSSNRDRQRKIRTAHGLRDRRMRLSLQVAQPFFKLQDMLGCDKASKTIEWLLLQSKAAINELRESKHGSNPTTKCTATSSSNSDDGEVESTTAFGDNRKARRVSTSTTKGEPNKRTRKRTTKEERKVARERAKRRTLERMMMHSRGYINNFFTTLSN